MSNQKVLYQHSDEWVIKRYESGKPITWEEWQGFRINSYERELLCELLVDDALCNYAESLLKKL